jgi:hypothetical protein
VDAVSVFLEIELWVYVGGQGPWGYVSHPIYYHFVIYEPMPTWHSIDLWCNATRPHWTRSVRLWTHPAVRFLARHERTSPAGDANAGPSDFLFTAAADCTCCFASSPDTTSKLSPLTGPPSRLWMYDALP